MKHIANALPSNENQVIGYLMEVERNFVVEEDSNTGICGKLDKPFDTVCWSKNGDCSKAEGDSAVVFDSADVAWAMWVAAFNQYRSYRRGSLHWRMRPVLSVNDKDGGKTYLVYARLLIG